MAKSAMAPLSSESTKTAGITGQVAVAKDPEDVELFCEMDEDPPSATTPAFVPTITPIRRRYRLGMHVPPKLAIHTDPECALEDDDASGQRIMFRGGEDWFIGLDGQEDIGGLGATGEDAPPFIAPKQDGGVDLGGSEDGGGSGALSKDTCEDEPADPGVGGEPKPLAPAAGKGGPGKRGNGALAGAPSRWLRQQQAEGVSRGKQWPQDSLACYRALAAAKPQGPPEGERPGSAPAGTPPPPGSSCEGPGAETLLQQACADVSVVTRPPIAGSTGTKKRGGCARASGRHLRVADAREPANNLPGPRRP